MIPVGEILEGRLWRGSIAVAWGQPGLLEERSRIRQGWSKDRRCIDGRATERRIVRQRKLPRRPIATNGVVIRVAGVVQGGWWGRPGKIGQVLKKRWRRGLITI